MDVRELRIGNWVTHLPSKNKSNANFIVSDIETFKKELINGIDADDCEPIPLTEEWLVGFGFEDQDTIIKQNIKYVNQLQNLYFALTGEELTFKNNEK